MGAEGGGKGEAGAGPLYGAGLPSGPSEGKGRAQGRGRGQAGSRQTSRDGKGRPAAAAHRPLRLEGPGDRGAPHGGVRQGAAQPAGSAPGGPQREPCPPGRDHDPPARSGDGAGDEAGAASAGGDRLRQEPARQGVPQRGRLPLRVSAGGEAQGASGAHEGTVEDRLRDRRLSGRRPVRAGGAPQPFPVRGREAAQGARRSDGAGRGPLSGAGSGRRGREALSGIRGRPASARPCGRRRPGGTGRRAAGLCAGPRLRVRPEACQRPPVEGTNLAPHPSGGKGGGEALWAHPEGGRGGGTPGA